MQEIGINLVVFDEPVCDAGNKRGVGARIDGQPLIGMTQNGVVHTRIDDVNLALGFLTHMRIVVMRDCAALTGLCRARAEHQDELSIFRGGKGGATVILRAVHVRRDAADLRGGIAVVELQIAAKRVHHTIERACGSGGNTRSVGDVYGLVTVLVDNFFELRGRKIDGLVPRNALELALAAFADALHRVVDAVWAVHPTTISAAAKARTRLRFVEISILARVGVHPHNLVILHMELQAATARAVDRAMAPCRGLFSLGERRRCRSKQRTRCRGTSTDSCQGAQSPRRFHERAAAYAHV